jgi:hypothetical protein
MAAVVPVEMYERFMAEREARFAAIERFRDSLPEYDPDEVLADTLEAVKAVRRERAERREHVTREDATVAGEPHPAADRAPTPASPEPAPRTPRPKDEGEEMGGEAPCQLHRFWDAEE